jgi:prepilin-type N-terminal cleavage/methylation domain-containing protein
VAESGFTLIELLVAMTVLVIVAGVAYSSFTQSLHVYQQDATQLALYRGVRTGLDEITRDLAGALVGQEDAALRFHAEDVPGEVEEYGLDFITFVASVTPVVQDPETAPLSPEAPSARATQSSTVTGEEEEPVPRDLLRVAYILGYHEGSLTSAADGQESPPLALLRVTSPTLDPDEAFGDALGQDPATMLQLLIELGATVEPVVENALSLDFAFYDGEEWFSMWDTDEQGVPKVVRVSLTVGDAATGRTFTRSSASVLTLNLVPASGQETGAQPGQGGAAQPGQATPGQGGSAQPGQSGPGQQGPGGQPTGPLG